MKPSRIWLITRVASALILISAAACGTASTGSKAYDSGIQGIVTYGPTCPVQRAGGPSCMRRYSAEIVVHQGANVVITFRSNSDGTFRVALQAGTYTLESAHSGLPFLKPLDVVVRPHAFTTVDVMFDSGIR